MGAKSLFAIRVALSFLALVLWIEVVANSSTLFVHGQYPSAIASEIVVTEAMYLIVGPIFVLGPLLDAYSDISQKRTPNGVLQATEPNRDLTGLSWKRLKRNSYFAR